MTEQTRSSHTEYKDNDMKRAARNAGTAFVLTALLYIFVATVLSTGSYWKESLSVIVLTPLFPALVVAALTFLCSFLDSKRKSSSS